MSAIDIVLVVIVLVAVGVAVACALQLKGLRAELQERGDDGAEMLAALEQANNALDTLNVALAETRRTANAIAQQQTTDAAVEQQRYLTIAREFSQAGDRMDDLRRETAQQLGANREGIEHRLDKVRETVDAQLAPSARTTTCSSIRCARRWTRNSPVRSTIACLHRLSR